MLNSTGRPEARSPASSSPRTNLTYGAKHGRRSTTTCRSCRSPAGRSTSTPTPRSCRSPSSSSMLTMPPNGHASRSTRTCAGKDIRIAAEKVGGRWYASLFYTAADCAAAPQVPSAADAVPAVGATHREGAVEKMVRACWPATSAPALALISPDELGAVHDYGGMILEGRGTIGTAGVTLTHARPGHAPRSPTAASGSALKKLVLRCTATPSPSRSTTSARSSTRRGPQKVCALTRPSWSPAARRHDLARSFASGRVAAATRLPSGPAPAKLERRATDFGDALDLQADVDQGAADGAADLFSGLTSSGSRRPERRQVVRHAGPHATPT